MAFLLTGGTAAQTSREIAHSCEAAKIPYLFASRSSSLSSTNPPCARFDWTDPSTYSNCFSYEFSGGEKLTAVYMIMPRVPELDKHMNAFIDYASNHGIKRFVLMAGTTTVLGGPGPGKVWEHLSDKGLDFAICKPTWFMGEWTPDLMSDHVRRTDRMILTLCTDNFTSTGYHLNTIREESKFYTCTGDAKIPFVSVEDISSVAFAALTIKKAPNTELRIVGPQALTHDEVCLLSCLRFNWLIILISTVLTSQTAGRATKRGFGSQHQPREDITGKEAGTNANGTEIGGIQRAIHGFLGEADSRREGRCRPYSIEFG